jgi:hypothetical protein
VARKPRHKKGAVFERWTLDENLGVGGNGEAWRVRDEQGQIRVMKLLYRGEERYERFKREVTVVNKLVPTGFPALPIEYAHLPEAPSKSDPAFYVMPEAVPVAKALAEKDIRAKAAAVQQYAEALATLLKEHGQNHRDVKPSNLYEHEGRFVLGDFGLITDPEAESLTDDGKAVGPWAFLPSEVFNPPPGLKLDWEKVDVYCLAMSLWCLAKGCEDPPRRIEPHGIMSLTRQLAVPAAISDRSAVEDREAVEYRHHVGELDTILAAATASEPTARPTLAWFAQQLGDWEEGIQTRDDFYAFHVQVEADEELVLRWLVSNLRHDRSLGLNVYDVQDPTSSSPVEGMYAGQFGAALDGLVESYKAIGERFPANGPPWHWAKVYPTYFGIEEVERERIDAETLPLLRALLKGGPQDLLEFSGTDDAVTFGDLVMSGPELYYLLRYMKGASFVDFTEDWASGPTVIVMHLKLTRVGRLRVSGTSATD